jgi:hypothetical protein
MPYALTGSQWSGTGFVDSYRRNRLPTPNEILAELKNTAWTCASINASTCANYPPRLYVITEHNQPRPKCQTKALAPRIERRLRSLPHLPARAKSAATIEEVTDHPLLSLLRHANAVHNAFDLWTNTRNHGTIRESKTIRFFSGGLTHDTTEQASFQLHSLLRLSAAERHHATASTGLGQGSLPDEGLDTRRRA